MSEHVADWRRRPRKRVLTPGQPSPKLAPAEMVRLSKAAIERRRDRQELYRAAHKAEIAFRRSISYAIRKAIDDAVAGNVEAARPAPVEGDRPSRGGNDVG